MELSTRTNGHMTRSVCVMERNSRGKKLRPSSRLSVFFNGVPELSHRPLWKTASTLQVLRLSVENRCGNLGSSG